MKCYYDCPIKAAYMAKHHGIFCQNPVAYGWHSGQYTIALSPHLSMNSDTRYYIHEDSMELLNPKNEDWGNVFNKGELIDQCKYNGNWRTNLGAFVISPYANLTFQINRRNNMPFIWPEVESDA